MLDTATGSGARRSHPGREIGSGDEASGKGAPIAKIRFPTYEFLALFLPIALLILVVGFSFAWLRTEARVEQLLDADASRLQLISGFIGAEVSGSLHHLHYLADNSVLRNTIERGDAQSLRNLEKVFENVVELNPNYRQVRWIDERGMERVRVDSDGVDVHRVADEDLQDKSDRYYFSEASALLPGELYASPIDLNVEQGQPEWPARAMLRIATPVVDSRRNSRGILIINIGMQHLFDVLHWRGPTTERGEFLLLNQFGVQLNPVAAGNSSADQGPGVPFGDSHPRLWENVSNRDHGSFEAWDGLWTWSRLSPLASLRQSYGDAANAAERIVVNHFTVVLLAHRPVEVLIEMRRDVRMLVSLGVILGIAVYGIALFLYLSGHVRLRYAELSAAHAVSRAAHLAKTKELEQRFHRLVEASSIGQLLIDADGQIEIANPAAERMLGYEPGDLNGESVDRLVPRALRDRHAGLRRQFLKAPVARRMGEGRELAATRKDGSTIAVEIGLNPYTDAGRQLVLVSIIDRSQSAS